MSDKQVDRNVYITVEGREVAYKPISFLKRGLIKDGLESDYRERGEPLDIPKAEVEVLGGDTIEVELSADSLEVEGDIEETTKRRELWAKHKDAVLRFENELKDLENDLLLSAILVELPEDESWIEEQKKLHIRIPDDPEKRRQHYIQTEILTSMEDIVDITSYIFTKSAVRTTSREDLAAAKESFRHQIFGTLEGTSGEGDRTKESETTNQE